MKQLLLIIVAAGLALLAYRAIELEKNDIPPETQTEELLLPQLTKPGLADAIHRMEFYFSHSTTIVARVDGTWSLLDHGRYPVRKELVTTLFRTLSTLRVGQVVHVRPDQYADLHLVASTNDLDSDFVQLRLLGRDWEAVIDLIIGSSREAAAQESKAYHVRMGDQVFLVSGALPELQSDPMAWVDNTLVDVDPESITRIRIVQSEQTTVLTRRMDKQGWYVAGMAPALDPDPEKIDKLKTILKKLSFLDVHKVDRRAFSGSQTEEYTFWTEDGLTYTLSVASDHVIASGNLRIMLDVQASPEDGVICSELTLQKAEVLRTQWQDRVFLIPGYRTCHQGIKPDDFGIPRKRGAPN